MVDRGPDHASVSYVYIYTYVSAACGSCPRGNLNRMIVMIIIHCNNTNHTQSRTPGGARGAPGARRLGPVAPRARRLPPARRRRGLSPAVVRAGHCRGCTAVTASGAGQTHVKKALHFACVLHFVFFFHSNNPCFLLQLIPVPLVAFTTTIQGTTPGLEACWTS